MKLSLKRNEYTKSGLRRKDLNEDPFVQFRLWFEQAREAQLLEPNAMSLATTSKAGQPTLRTVLLKAFDSRGFVFFTNYESTKAKQIEENPQVALLFPWFGLERQLTILGTAKKISTAASVRYFLTRPFGSQLGAWVSEQSKIISTRQILEMKWEQMKEKFATGRIPLPTFWGGYRVSPVQFEFWQGRENRLHDRFQYVLTEKMTWKIERLAP